MWNVCKPHGGHEELIQNSDQKASMDKITLEAEVEMGG
jgi:hypothetical protein